MPEPPQAVFVKNKPSECSNSGSSGGTNRRVIGGEGGGNGGATVAAAQRPPQPAAVAAAAAAAVATAGAAGDCKLVIVGNGRTRVRRIVRTATRHVTIVSYNGSDKESVFNTSHHATTVSFPLLKNNDRLSPALRCGSSTSVHQNNASGGGIIGGSSGGGGGSDSGSGSYLYLQQHYLGPAQQQLQQHQYTHHQHNHGHHHHHHHPHSHQQQQQQSHLNNIYSTCSVQSSQPPSSSPSLSAGAIMAACKKGSVRGAAAADCLKRSRQQNVYELSQDLLDKQIELLERKYGGLKARIAAITIQRAFRHYVMVKKFASITAMAKAEKRMSHNNHHRLIYATNPPNNRVSTLSSSLSLLSTANSQDFHGHDQSSGGGSTLEMLLDQDVSGGDGMGDDDGGMLINPFIDESGSSSMLTAHQTSYNAIIMDDDELGACQLQQQQQQRGNFSSSSGSGAYHYQNHNHLHHHHQYRVTPGRTMSLRERRQADTSPSSRMQMGGTTPPPPPPPPQTMTLGSAWGVSNTSLPQHSHPHVNILHAEQHYYSSPMHSGALVHCGPSGGNGGGLYLPQQQQFHYRQHIQPQMLAQIQYSPASDLSQTMSEGGGGGGQLLDSPISMTSSWNSNPTPHTPYYSAAQIYMRPRAGVCQLSAAAAAAAASKRVPPEVPKRTSSITLGCGGQIIATNSNRLALRPNGLTKNTENGSLSSVQSSGSESSTSNDRIQCGGSGGSVGAGGSTGSVVMGNIVDVVGMSDQSASPQWKRKGSRSGMSGGGGSGSTSGGGNGGGPIAQSPESQQDCLSSHTSAAQYSIEQHDQLATPLSAVNYKVSETLRKRQYRVGLNLFNKKPERGVAYLIRRGFLENTPQGVARFLISRKGLSRQMIGEYLGNLQNPFNMAVLECFANELDLSGMQIDVALRKFQAFFRMPGEAQKIERLMEIFSQRYCHCNNDIVSRLRSSDTVFVLAFAIIMLNTDLHTPNLKPERRMRIDDFIKNLRGIDDCHDIDTDILAGIYERVKVNEFKPGSDHVTQVMKVQATIVVKKPNLALPHRRLVCYCRLYEIPDINKKERPGVHQREVFLFNDLLVITKIFSKKKSSVTYTFRNSYPLCGMVVNMLDVANYAYCIQLSQKVDGKILVTFNARNEHDRFKFAEDLRESISEMDEMESLRIEAELERQKTGRSATSRANGNGGTNGNNANNGGSGSGGGGCGGGGATGTGVGGGGGGNNAGNNAENRDSGVADVEICSYPYKQAADQQNDAQLKRSALSNSLLDMHEQFNVEKPQRRGSVGSLDSGMSISFQSTSASTGSRTENKYRLLQQQQQHLQHPIATGSSNIMATVTSGGQPILYREPKREQKKIRTTTSDGSVVVNQSDAPEYGRSTEV